jgi:hypothetical protein
MYGAQARFQTLRQSYKELLYGDATVYPSSLLSVR